MGELPQLLPDSNQELKLLEEQVVQALEPHTKLGQVLHINQARQAPALLEVQPESPHQGLPIKQVGHINRGQEGTNPAQAHPTNQERVECNQARVSLQGLDRMEQAPKEQLAQELLPIHQP